MGDVTVTKDFERLGEGQDTSVVVLGEAPCPNGCGRTGRHVSLWGSKIVTLCDPCQTQAEQERDRVEREERVASLMQRSGATPRLALWTLDTYPQDNEGRKAVAAARGWIDQFMQGSVANLMLHGPVGSGKTGLAWGIVRSLIEEREVRAAFVNFPDLLDRMREAFARKQPFFDYDPLARAKVLAVDDVGAERPTDFARAELLRLVDYRHGHLLPTIYTSNYSQEQLAVRLGGDDLVVGQRIVSRMTDGAHFKAVRSADRRRGA